MPMGCVFSLSTSTFFGWISPLEFMVHSIHSYSRTTKRSACHTPSMVVYGYNQSKDTSLSFSTK